MPFFHGGVVKPQTTISSIIQDAQKLNSISGTGVTGNTHIRKSQHVDLNKLYLAVAYAESGNCKTAWHKKANNCVSIMSWTGGKRHLRSFASINDSKNYFKQLWLRRYGDRLPTKQDAIKYTGNDKAKAWHKNVMTFYTTH